MQLQAALSKQRGGSGKTLEALFGAIAFELQLGKARVVCHSNSNSNS